MDFLQYTNRYYSKWLGEEEILNSDFEGVKFIYSQERNQIQAGYPRKIDLYVFCQPERMIFSYGDRWIQEMDALRVKVDSSATVEQLKGFLGQVFGVSPRHSIKYVFDNLPDEKFVSKPLESVHYKDYLNFFRENNPACRNTDWVYDYFLEIVERGGCFGYFQNERLVSCTDAPEVPYMSDAVVEMGVNTLGGFRGKGYGADVCRACLSSLLKHGKCPIWSAGISNTASQKLAQKVGFVKLADVLTLD